MEPEHISVTDNGDTAYVTLQENNAVAKIDIKGCAVKRMFPLGYKVHIEIVAYLALMTREPSSSIRAGLAKWVHLISSRSLPFVGRAQKHHHSRVAPPCGLEVPHGFAYSAK